MACAPSEDSDQNLRCPHGKAWVLSYPLSAQRGCPGWSESSLGTQVILLVLSCTGSVCYCCESETFEPCHGIMVLFVLLKLIFFKRACTAIQQGYMSDFWSDPSSTSILRVCEHRGPSLVAYVVSTIISWAGSFGQAQACLLMIVFFLRNVPCLSIGLPWNEWNNLEGL